jgi:serine/threonine protein kinase
MSSGDAASKSERDDSITAPSLLDEAEPSLSTLGRLEEDRSSAASASRERPAEWGAEQAWGHLAASTDGELGREVASGGTLPSVCPSFAFARGTLVGQRYLVRRFIGRGGMGQVYEAYDRVLREPVALKTTTGQSSADAQRLLEEVRMARRITHPNVCRLYDAGVHEEREPQRTSYFLTMEYLEGHTLRRRLRHGLPPLAQVFGIGRQLLIGLAAIHAAGVLHRDFKSENVMLRLPGNGTGQAVIMDFGLARPLRLDEPLPGGAGAGAGSRGYMAPEQIENLPLGPETDLFAFGVVMFEMLTGRLPFERAPSAAALGPTPFDLTSPAPSQLRPELPAELDGFVLKCLSAQRQNRFRSAERALAALHRVFERSFRTSPSGAGWVSGYGFPRRGARFVRPLPLRRAH